MPSTDKSQPVGRAWAARPRTRYGAPRTPALRGDRSRRASGYRIFSALDPEAPSRAAGQFYMLVGGDGWGAARGTPLPSAGVLGGRRGAGR